MRIVESKCSGDTFDMDKVLKLIEQRIMAQDSLAAEVLFGWEFGAEDWSEERAVELLFKYADEGGFGEYVNLVTGDKV